MPLLYYWRGDNYNRDLDYGVGYHLNQGNPLLHSIEIGDSLWAFTRRKDGVYALAAELIVSAKTTNPEGYRYGKYRLWGNLTKSRYFSVTGQPDVSAVIRALSIKSKGDVTGRAFQGYAAVRKISQGDQQILRAYSQHIPVEPRARILPEERLEALIFSGDVDAVSRLIQDEPSGLAQERKSYLFEQARAKRSRALVQELQRLYDNACQICGWAPMRHYGVRLCEAHHVHWLSRGGKDDLTNLVLMCPNHHRAIHQCDAQYDWESSSFAFPTKYEPIQLSKHDLHP